MKAVANEDLTGQRGAHAVLRAALTALAVLAMAGTPAVIYFHMHPPAAPLPWALLGGVTLGAGLIGAVIARWGRRLWCGPADALARWPAGLMLPLVVGLCLRAASQLLLSPAAASDGLSYVGLARQLVQDGQYGTPGAYAFWPPGYPFILAPGAWMGLPRELWWGVVNACSFVLAMFGARALLAQLRVPALHGLVYWLLALWPTHVLCSTLPEKEMVIVGLLPWICCFALQIPQAGWRAALKAGLLTGVVVLVQPSLQFLAPGVLLAALIHHRGRSPYLAAGLLGIAAMLVVVAPWTARNYSVFNQVVPISTNGGDVLYRANNDLATGVYTERATIDLNHLDELGKDAASKRHAVEWIRSHPIQFLQLGGSKLMHFLGDDSSGAYSVFSRGGVSLSRGAYLLVRQGSALPWLAVWVLLLAWLWRARYEAAGLSAAELFIVFAPIGYLTLIHAIFESGPKYHLPLLVPVLVLLAATGSAARTAPR